MRSTWPIRQAADEGAEKPVPPGLEYDIFYDTTPFINRSIDEVLTTLVIAVLLVALVVLFFLQDWKAMILPMIDVPVSLVGTFAVMAALGFSLNNLTLFGLVLAIGIVVDDAIVVLENIERLIATGLDARTATIRAMDELTGPIVAITLVLTSVFFPSIFIPGLTGQFYRQFALTIATAVIISAINALTLTPSRAVSIFRTEEIDEQGHPKKEALPWWFFGIRGGIGTRWLAGLKPHRRRAPRVRSGDDELAPLGPAGCLVRSRSPRGRPLGLVYYWARQRRAGRLFRAFNRLFERVTAVYGWLVGRLLRLAAVVGIVYCGLLVGTWWGVTFAPKGLIPTQDQGYLLVNGSFPTRPRCMHGGDHHAHRQNRHRFRAWCIRSASPARRFSCRRMVPTSVRCSLYSRTSRRERGTMNTTPRSPRRFNNAVPARSRGQLWASLCAPHPRPGQRGGISAPNGTDRHVPTARITERDRSARETAQRRSPFRRGLHRISCRRPGALREHQSD